MSDPLRLYVDGELRLEAARGGGVPGQLRALFARIDADMDAGIELDGVHIAAPDRHQRRACVVEHLLHALGSGQTDFARALLIYLADRCPALRAVYATTGPDSWRVEFDPD